MSKNTKNLTTFAALSIGAAFYNPESEKVFEFVKESEKSYSTTYNGKREVFRGIPNEVVEECTQI